MNEDKIETKSNDLVIRRKICLGFHMYFFKEKKNSILKLPTKE
jgi:hypothetical protein